MVVKPTQDPQTHYALLFGGYKMRDDAAAQLLAVEMAAAMGMGGSSSTHRGFGHEDEGGELQDLLPKAYATGLWRLEFATMTWQLLDEESSNGSPPPRLYWPSALAYPHNDSPEHYNVLVYGGATQPDGASGKLMAATGSGALHRLTLQHCPPGFGGDDCSIPVDSFFFFVFRVLINSRR